MLKLSSECFGGRVEQDRRVFGSVCAELLQDDVNDQQTVYCMNEA
jgi:hypothetical protein